MACRVTYETEYLSGTPQNLKTYASVTDNPNLTIYLEGGGTPHPGDSGLLTITTASMPIADYFRLPNMLEVISFRDGPGDMLYRLRVHLVEWVDENGAVIPFVYV
jgi:hypothetical protein